MVLNGILYYESSFEPTHIAVHKGLFVRPTGVGTVCRTFRTPSCDQLFPRRVSDSSLVCFTPDIVEGMPQSINIRLVFDIATLRDMIKIWVSLDSDLKRKSTQTLEHCLNIFSLPSTSKRWAAPAKKDNILWSSDKEIQVAQPLLEMRNTTKSSLTPLVSKRDRHADRLFVKITQDLVFTNEEIWEGCTKESFYSTMHNKLCFRRFGFNSLNVSNTITDTHLLLLTLKTISDVERKTFFLALLLKALSTVVFPRFSNYVRNSFLLEKMI